MTVEIAIEQLTGMMLGVVIPSVGVTWGAVHYVYKRGVQRGMDTDCERRIKESISDLESKLDTAITNRDEMNNEIKQDFMDVHVRITSTQNDVGEIKGSVKVIKDLVVKHMGD